MTVRLSLALVLASMLLVACAPQSRQPGAKAGNLSIAQRRAMIQQQDPKAVTGLVTAVADGMVAVGDTPVQDFKVGDDVQFIGPDGSVFGHGVVRAIVDDSLHVRLADPKTAPHIGDLAVHVKD